MVGLTYLSALGIFLRTGIPLVMSAGELLLLREDGIRGVVDFWVGLLPPRGYSGPPSFPGLPVNKLPYQHLP